MTPAEIDETLRAFYDDVAEYHLQPLWTQTRNLMPPSPRPEAVPWLWRGKELRALAERAGELIPVERGGERRVLALSNPGLGGRPFATPTLWGAVQYLGPYESAPAHRHTPGAIRFVLEGEGVWTTVDGDACDMHPGDLILTPGWRWHDHCNGGASPMLWFDGLDLPLAHYLDAIFYEDHPALAQPVEGHNLSEARNQEPAVVPSPDAQTPVASPLDISPLLVYRWADTDAALTALARRAPASAVSVSFINPATRAPALPTFDCEMHRIAPESRTPATRRVGSSVFVVYRGSGCSVIAGVRFEWEPGDMFVVPSWHACDHEASAAGADLFSISDAPVLRALGLYRTEALPDPQPVSSTFGG